MSKRPAEESADGHPKRRKPDAATDIHTARQLQSLLSFQQDAAQMRDAIGAFKAFLESIVYPEDKDDVPRRRAILREFLESQKPRTISDDSVYLPDLMQTWSWADQTNVENLFSAVTAVLALLLKTLSTEIAAREYGLLLGRTVLLPAQAKLAARAMGVPKHKEYIISPALRLLTEVISFDGGALARNCYAQRDTTFDARILGRNLGLRRAQTDRPSVRMNAVRYVLAHLRFQTEGAKMDIMRQGNVVRALLDGLDQDTPGLIREVLSVLKSVVLDGAVSRSTKGFLFNERSLHSLAQLYRVASDDSEPPLQDVVHEFMLLVCTSPAAGVIRPSTGWYPLGADQDEEVQYQSAPIRNRALAEFLPTLRPYANDLERELMVSIFDAVPELVAHYFSRKSTFAFDPKLTATWVGFAALLFSTVQLPVPHHFGRKEPAALPPPASVAIESILPRPLTQKILSKCIYHSSDLVRFFALRLLVAAFEKLRNVLRLYDGWVGAREGLITEFCLRCPRMKEVIECFRKIPDAKLLQREAISRLLALYYTVTPQLALDEKFGVSVALTSALQQLESVEGEERQLRLITLGHLVRIASCSPDMLWWSKPESLRFSPFVSLLRLLVSEPNTEIRALLSVVVRDCAVLQTETEKSALDALVLSLKAAPESVFTFLDGCLQRLTRRPIKYADDADALGGTPISLLLLVLVEQWQFAASTEAGPSVAAWLAELLPLLQAVGEDANALEAVATRLAADPKTDKRAKKAFKSALARTVTLPSQPSQPSQPEPTQLPPFDLTALLPPPESDNHPGLMKWKSKPPAAAIEDGSLSLLISCLSSTAPHIRRESLLSLRTFSASLATSSYAERIPISLLLGEVLETAQPTTGLPPLLGAFARACIPVLTDPTHPVYPEVNTFLLRGPSWHPPNVTGWFSTRLLGSAPEETGREGDWWRCVCWFLAWVVDGLRGEQDVELLRRGRVFERIMALAAHPVVRQAGGLSVERAVAVMGGEGEAGLQTLAGALVVGVVLRACAVGGVGTMVTRAGALGWLGGVEGGKQVEEVVRKSEGVEEWIGGRVVTAA
ncbi:hypothetical protein EJ06DRAFT_516420 [Trichodelitschia bisporula]|uniref:Ribosome biogenesis protein Urb1 n=1 Tax=Trichodelitschia bisporula TaxID=703511 RepID=A0A6G1HKZ4_9PEZI|nr:hypothetical protein EJ06DRAFT_516420 [Trichodelitschia bisporula]